MRPNPYTRVKLDAIDKLIQSILVIFKNDVIHKLPKVPYSALPHKASNLPSQGISLKSQNSTKSLLTDEL